MKIAEIVYSGKIINVVKSFDSGQPSRYFETVKHPGSAAVVPVNGSGKLILVNQYREAVGDFLLEIPAGKLEPGEPPEDCAFRELEEETGYRAGNLEKLCEMFMTPGYCDEKIHVFAATKLVRSQANPDEDEIISAVEVDFAEALDLIDRGQIRDAKTVAGILQFARKNKWSLAR